LDYSISTTFSPLANLTIGGLKTDDATCNLWGWGSARDINRRDSVSVHNPSYCNPQKSQVFCSIFPSNQNSSCDLGAGSPILCNNLSTIDGIYLGNSVTCEPRGNDLSLEYISLGSHKEWIEQAMCKFSRVS
jgi:hypothetical protein